MSISLRGTTVDYSITLGLRFDGAALCWTAAPTARSERGLLVQGDTPPAWYFLSAY